MGNVVAIAKKNLLGRAMADRCVSFCSSDFSFFIAVLFLILSDIGLRSTVTAWGRHHQESSLYVKYLPRFRKDREECRRHLGCFLE